MLTLDPGVQLLFASGRSLRVGYRSSSSGNEYCGALHAVGTPGTEVLFSSAATTPQPGDWGEIRINAWTDSPQIILDHCIVEYGGGNGTQRNVLIVNSTLTIQNTSIRESIGRGLWLGQLELAFEKYTISLALNPDNGNARRKLKEIESRPRITAAGLPVEAELPGIRSAETLD